MKDYADKFYGFGTWNAKIWFVGIEEAGGWEEQDVMDRLHAWEQGGKMELENASTFYPASGNNWWHGHESQHQETWGELIRMLLLARGESDTDEAILNYQRNVLGRADGETCLAELLPLPSPSIKEWRYRNWSKFHWLESREKYYAHLLVTRAAELARKIKSKPPSVVIFYGSSFHRTWSCVAGANWTQAIPGQFQTIKTAFFVTKHPADPKLGLGRDGYFRQIGNYLHLEHGKRFAVGANSSDQPGTARIKKTAPIMPARLDWPSAVGNFLLNFGVLDLGVLDFLESSLPPEQFAKVKDWHLRDRIKIIMKHLQTGGYSTAKLDAFERFFIRLEPIRELRNHIAHGTMRLGLTPDQRTWEVTLSLPRDMDGSNTPGAQHLTFKELETALGELPRLIEEFEKLSGIHKNEK